MSDVIEAYKAFDERQPGWIKVELQPSTIKGRNGTDARDGARYSPAFGRRPQVLAGFVLLLLAGTLSGAASLSAREQRHQTLRHPLFSYGQPVAPNEVAVDVSTTQVVSVFTPDRALGAGVDAENDGAVAQIYTPSNVAAMLSAGLGPLSYRLYTELSVQDWHWNPRGRWSDSRREGYWTGDFNAIGFIRDSYGYRLPHRGLTHDQGNDDDYSRLDDGDLSTYWKSNPYLAQPFTGEDDALHPQWALVDLGTLQKVNAIVIHWANPYARRYSVQYWNGPDAIGSPELGNWITFPGGAVTSGRGGTVELHLARTPIDVQFVRLLMNQSSNTCDSHGPSDVRNCVGYAVAELGIGIAASNFRDTIHHAASTTQTVTYVSSVDPWHSAGNRVQDEEQPGLDAVFRSGLTRNLPAVVPVSLLYGTPDDAVSELRYLERRHDQISKVELGEEPDGQYITPEDYGALYVQWARRIRAFDARLPLGGPVFQGVTQDVPTWPNASGDVSWLHRFLQYLRARGARSALNFMSFEHYPFDACDANPWQDLRSEPDLVRGIMRTWRNDGLPANVPVLITEANFSANAGAPFQDIVGALWFADFAGSFLSSGGQALFLYQYVPEPLQQTIVNCNSWGSYGMFVGSPNYAVRQKTAQYFAAQLIMHRWAQAVDAPHALLSVATRPARESAVTAYAVRRPDARYGLLLVNKDQWKAHAVRLTFHGARNEMSFRGPVTRTTFGKAQYVWHASGPNGFADPDGPAITETDKAAATYSLPAGSITVLSGILK